MAGKSIREIPEYVRALCGQAKLAARRLAILDPSIKDEALRRMASSLRLHAESLQADNAKDLAAGRRKGLAPAMLDRLELTDSRIEEMARGMEEVAAVPDPVGEVVSQWRRPGGFEVGRMRIPLGVIGIIYESRPNVTADAAALCFKAGNATVLRGGSEAYRTNLAIVRIICRVLESCAIPAGAVQFVETTRREAVGELLKQDDTINVIIPRGGKDLIRRVVEESRVPVIKHYEGICHVYVHSEADLEMAIRIAVNAKAQRPATCNAMETLLVDQAVADRFLPQVSTEFQRLGVKIRGCSRTALHMPVHEPATEESFRTEFLSLECNVRVVEGFEDAVDHILRYGSNHTDVIVTRSVSAARRFVREVDSSSVMVNASSRLADGSVYGLGAEIGISTDRLHAYGPMGVRELTTTKFFVYGDGTLRE